MSDEEATFVSTGRLPPGEAVRAALEAAHARYVVNREGERSQVYPALAEAPSDRLGVCLAGVDGALYGVGDYQCEFTIMSVAKPFVFALVCEWLGAEAVRRAVGVDATGLPFDSLAAIERDAEGRTNPMVNAGAIATTSLVPGDTLDERWAFIASGLSAFAGRALALDADVYASAVATNHRNQAIARLLWSLGRLGVPPDEATELYTRQSSLSVTAQDLAIMGATLADGGVNPVTGRRVVDEATCHYTLAVMVTAGLYETSGDWLYEVGLPGKSGIAGGIVAVAPGKCGLATFAPRLDARGNSVNGQLVAAFLSKRLGLDLFASRAEPARAGARAA